ncbi:unnamed protein product [Paramecium octaurelia]|uniref:Uncharacterized protein n=1 Tax=Paramecium octaurelia TaxID=43137 RepID=A0A8S1WT12_PAROT|nr:unnamed protein product [Paramecium octaurelia]
MKESQKTITKNLVIILINQFLQYGNSKIINLGDQKNGEKPQISRASTRNADEKQQQKSISEEKKNSKSNLLLKTERKTKVGYLQITRIQQIIFKVRPLMIPNQNTINDQ